MHRALPGTEKQADIFWAFLSPNVQIFVIVAYHPRFCNEKLGYFLVFPLLSISKLFYNYLYFSVLSKHYILLISFPQVILLFLAGGCYARSSLLHCRAFSGCGEWPTGGFSLPSLSVVILGSPSTRTIKLPFLPALPDSSPIFFFSHLLFFWRLYSLLFIRGFTQMLVKLDHLYVYEVGFKNLLKTLVTDEALP